MFKHLNRLEYAVTANKIITYNIEKTAQAESKAASWPAPPAPPPVPPLTAPPPPAPAPPPPATAGTAPLGAKAKGVPPAVSPWMRGRYEKAEMTGWEGAAGRAAAIAPGPPDTRAKLLRVAP